MDQDRIAAIDRHLDALRARRAQIVARLSAEDRRNRTRQVIVLGGWLITHRPDLVEQIKTGLRRPQDRRAFGLPELAEDPTVIAALRNDHD